MSVKPTDSQSCNSQSCEVPPEFVDGSTFFYVNSSRMCTMGSCTGYTTVAWEGIIKFCGSTSGGTPYNSCTIAEVSGSDGYYYKRGDWSGIGGVCMNGSAAPGGCHAGSPAMYKVSRRPM